MWEFENITFEELAEIEKMERYYCEKTAHLNQNGHESIPQAA